MKLRPENPALTNSVTIHPHSRRSPENTRLLKPAANNNKLGKGSSIIVKGKWRGMPMYQLTLEERATCPSTCPLWDSCFGNNMAFAHRIDHRHHRFLEILAAEISELCVRYRFGVVIRPHVLGDYFSEDYARFWVEQTKKHKNLHIFGYTHWQRGTPIGDIIDKWNDGDRVWVRFSDAGGPMSANVGTDREGFTCPEQTGLTESCLTCGACWSTTTPVNFLPH